MKTNSEKSKEMIITYAHGNLGNEVPNILIESKVVERVYHVQLLGITLSNDLTWKRQYCEESWKDNLHTISAETRRC